MGQKSSKSFVQNLQDLPIPSATDVYKNELSYYQKQTRLAICDRSTVVNIFGIWRWEIAVDLSHQLESKGFQPRVIEKHDRIYLSWTVKRPKSDPPSYAKIDKTEFF